MRRALPVLLVVLLTSAPAELRADCESSEGHIRWVSGIDIRQYQVGEGFQGYFLDTATLGNFLLTATDLFGTRVYEIDSPGNLSLASSTLTGYVDRITVSGDLAYIISTGAMSIVSVTEDGIATTVSTHSAPSARDVAVQGDYAYVAGSSLFTVDVSDPASPVTVDTDAANGDRVVTYGDRLYVASGNDGVEAFDISNPSAPVSLGLVIATYGPIGGLEVEADHLFVSWLNHGVTAHDLADPDVPVEVGYLDTGVSAGFVIDEGYAAVSSPGGLTFLDISDPTNIVSTGAFRSAGLFGMAVKDGIAYVATGSLQAIELNDVDNPSAVNTIAAFAEGQDLRVIEDHLVLYLRDSMEVISIADGETPVAVASIPFNRVRGLDTQGDYAYVSDLDGFHVVDLAQPSTPSVVASIAGFFGDVVATGNRIYLSYDGDTTTLDITDPTSPTVLGSYDSGLFSVAFAAEGNDVYLSYEFESSAEIIHYDFTNPSSPSYVGDQSAFDPIHSMTAHNGELWIGNRTGLLRFDRSNLDLLGSVGECSLAGGGIHLSPSGAIQTWNGSFHTFSPVNGLEYLSTGSTATASVTGLASSGEYLYVTDADGLHVFLEPCVPASTEIPPATQLPLTLRSQPNPSWGPTSFRLQRASRDAGRSSSQGAQLEIFSVDGRILRTLPVTAGSDVHWDGTDEQGRAVPAGVVLARWSGEGEAATTTVRVLR